MRTEKITYLRASLFVLFTGYWWLSEGEWGKKDMFHLCGKRKANTNFWLENLKERDHFRNTDVDGKVKVNLSLCFSWAPCHEGVLGEWSYSSTHSLTSALDVGEWSASYPGRFTPRETVPCYLLDRRLSRPQSRSGHGGEEKNSQPPPGIEP
jgi:hypothetical protein